MVVTFFFLCFAKGGENNEFCLLDAMHIWSIWGFIFCEFSHDIFANN